jgi:hypothetical protein
VCDVRLLQHEIRVPPSESDELSSTKTGGPVQQHHDTLPLRKLQEKRLELFRGQDVWSTEPLG